MIESNLQAVLDVLGAALREKDNEIYWIKDELKTLKAKIAELEKPQKPTVLETR